MGRRSTKKWGDLSKHPGVYVTERKNKDSVTHRARWRDPDSGRWQYVTLEEKNVSSPGEALTWCIDQANKNRDRERELKNGAARRVDLSVEEAIDDFFERKREKWRGKTEIGYQTALDQFKAWCERNLEGGISDLRRADLNRFRDWLETRPSKRHPDQKRSRASINSYLAGVRVFLNDAARMEWLQIDSQVVRDVLKAGRTEKPLPAFLRQNEVRKLLKASLGHDSKKYRETREEHRGEREKGTTPRYAPAAPLVAAALLTGCRIGEIEGLRWDEVDLERQEITLSESRTKTRHARLIDLGVCPSLVEMLERLKLQAGDCPFVFGIQRENDDGELEWIPLPHTLSESTRKRLVKTYTAPRFSWHGLRKTCATFLTNAPGIYGGASAYRSARRTGHSVVIAERDYTGLVTDIPADAQTLETAMGAEKEFRAVVDAVGSPARAAELAAG